MSCPLVGAAAARLDELDDGERRRLVEHLGSCPECRRRALRADPTLVFSLLPSLEVGDREIAEILSTTLAMRRVRRLEGSRRVPSERLRRGAAAALLLAGALLLLPGGGGGPAPKPPAEIPVATGESAFGQALSASRIQASSGPTPPVIEGLDRPLARIYQLTEDDLSLVMIVDETLDL